MAGIGAASATETFAAAGADASTDGFLTNEQIALSVTPSGSGYAWSLAIPSDSAAGVAALDDAESATPKFTPDVEGFYVVTVVVDGSTTYVLRIAVVSVAHVRMGEALNLMPLADAQVPTPQAGATLYFSTDEDAPAWKDTAGTVHTL